MPKKLIQRYMPDPKTIREHKHLQVFGGSVGLVIHKSADTTASAEPAF